MRLDDLREAVLEAERFLRKALEIKPQGYKVDQISYTKETAACLRSSLDLTRALAQLRKGGN